MHGYQTREGSLATFAIGLVVMLAGVLTASSLHAQSTHGDKKFALVTVPVDSGLDAVFFYDDLTRDLTGAVPNVTGGFAVAYKINLGAAFAKSGKPIEDPQFLIVGGRASIQTRGSAPRLGAGVLYVTELRTGQLAMFGIPWNRAWVNRAAGATPVELHRLQLIQIRPDVGGQ